MTNQLTRVIVFATLLVQAQLLCTGQVIPQRGFYEDKRLLPVLKNNGIDPGDEFQLVAALVGPDEHIACAAAYALGKLPQSPSVQRALKQSLASGPELVSVFAARALSTLDSKEWVPTALKRLGSAQNVNAELQLSSLLAAVGNFDGWFAVERQLQTDGPYTLAAMEAVPFFARMNQRGTSRVDVTKYLETMLLTADGPKREAIKTALRETRNRLSLLPK